MKLRDMGMFFWLIVFPLLLAAAEEAFATQEGKGSYEAWLEEQCIETKHGDHTGRGTTMMRGTLSLNEMKTAAALGTSQAQREGSRRMLRSVVREDPALRPRVRQGRRQAEGGAEGKAR